jgi:hypothetical protein
VARASVLALFAKKAAFLRTPKTSERTRWWEALKSNWAESLLAVFGLAGICGALTKYHELAGLLLAGLLLFPTLGMASAPLNSWAARRAALPADLRERRVTEYRRDRHTFAAGIATGGVAVVLGVTVAAVALLVTGHQVRTPNLVGPAQGSTSSPSAKASPSASPSVSPSPSGSPSVSVSPTVSPSALPSSPSSTVSPTAPATGSASSSPTAGASGAAAKASAAATP